MKELKRLSFTKDTLRALGEKALRSAVGGDGYGGSGSVPCTQHSPCYDISNDGNQTMITTSCGQNTCWNTCMASTPTCSGTCQLTCPGPMTQCGW